MKKKNKRTDWHAGFAGGLEICFSEYHDVLDIDREYELTKESPRIDFIVIKKDTSVLIDNDIGRFFKKHNIIEYKNPNDALNIDVVWKCIGYAGLYKGLGKTVNAIPEHELTISIFRSKYPRKFFTECRKNSRKVEQTAPGVYRVEGFSAIDLQIVVTKELEDENLLALKIMMEDADKDDIRRFIEKSKDIYTPGLLEDYRVVVKISSAVNEQTFEELLEENTTMSTIERLEKAREKALADSRKDGKKEGREEKQIEDIRSLMETLNLSAKDAMKALKISAANQKKYIAML